MSSSSQKVATPAHSEDQVQESDQGLPNRTDRPSDENPGVPGYFIFCFENSGNDPKVYKSNCGLVNEQNQVVTESSAQWSYQLPGGTQGVTVTISDSLDQNRKSDVTFEFRSETVPNLPEIAKATEIKTKLSQTGDVQPIEFTAVIKDAEDKSPYPVNEAADDQVTNIETCMYRSTVVPLGKWGQSNQTNDFAFCQCIKDPNTGELFFGNCQDAQPNVPPEDIILVI